LITECSFPNRLQEVADVSLHLTPDSLAVELAKLERRVPVFIYHFKPPYVDELRVQLAETKLPHPVEELRQDHTYTF
jgi:ribonuclease BN (tRNA processing enzyme)